MAADAGESTGEALVSVPLVSVLDAALSDLSGGERVRREIAAPAAAALVRVPTRALTQALRGVIKNALEASVGGGDVQVRLGAEAERFRLAVVDHGTGMPPDVLARAGEPFFTTKQTDGLARGMGLGLFLARVVLERLGGELELDSAAGRGTIVTLVLPAGAATIGRIEDGGVGEHH
jgi:two-component system sensor histidine kinase RegB